MLSVLVATLRGDVDNGFVSTTRNPCAYAMHTFPVRVYAIIECPGHRAYNISSLHIKVANVRSRIRSLCRLDIK